MFDLRRYNKVENSATGHTPADDSYVITIEPTCTKGGAATATCATCGEAYDIVLDALGHNYVTLDTAIDGHTDHVDRKVICSNCQDLKSENEKYHLEWVDGNYTTETIVAGNCTTSAIYKDTCTFAVQQEIVRLKLRARIIIRIRDMMQIPQNLHIPAQFVMMLNHTIQLLF